mmetsp:Transcript_3203/g.7124  ORF Transcript_3203/g.7124 Transcript_3203/m.7124 type:complete len:222 (+) Transcript_3203:2940-3605(+)
MARQDLAGEAGGSALDSWAWRKATSLRNVSKDVRRDSMGEIVFCITAGRVEGVIQMFRLVSIISLEFASTVASSNLTYLGSLNLVQVSLRLLKELYISMACGLMYPKMAFRLIPTRISWRRIRTMYLCSTGLRFLLKSFSTSVTYLSCFFALFWDDIAFSNPFLQVLLFTPCSPLAASAVVVVVVGMPNRSFTISTNKSNHSFTSPTVNFDPFIAFVAVLL